MEESPSSKKRKCLNDFLELCQCSPIRKTLCVEWKDASERTRNDHVKKAVALYQGILSTLAPQQENSLHSAVQESAKLKMEFGIKEEVSKEEVLESFLKAYQMATTWPMKRQILSLIAPHYTLAEIQKYMAISKYHFTSARYHAAEHGPGGKASRETAKGETFRCCSRPLH